MQHRRAGGEAAERLHSDARSDKICVLERELALAKDFPPLPISGAKTEARTEAQKRLRSKWYDRTGIVRGLTPREILGEVDA